MNNMQTLKRKDAKVIDASQGRLYNEDEVAKLVEMASYRATREALDEFRHRADPNLDNSTIRAFDDQTKEVNEMPSGFKQQVTLSDGRKIMLRGKTFSEAIENALRSFVLNEESEPVPFTEYAENWFELYHKPHCSPRWLTETKMLMVNYIIPFFKKKDVNEITVSDIQRFFNSMSDLSLSTKKHIRYLLNGIFDSAMEDGLIPRNIATSKRITVTGKECPRSALTPEQVRDICQHMQELDLQQRLLISLFLYTGMRRGEVLALEWRNVDMDRALIHVIQSVDFPDSNTPAIKPPKSKAGFRDIPILPPLMDVLKEAKARARQRFLIGDEEQPITKRAYEWLYRDIKRRINLYGATAHVFRHTFITMSSLFLDPKTLQSIAGHSKCDITMNRYAHTVQNEVEKAGEKLADIYRAV